ncbi:MAG: FAD-dependent oxidoreductase [Burkholderiales bacterium]|nr:FAD-dependent oxidoreductase [Burkholderiales bacterium]
MSAAAQPVLRDIVLVGGGHSHVGVLRLFGMNPVPGVRLTLICRDAHTPYSGMLPGYVAGHYSHDEMHIDLRRLAAFAGARFFHDEAVGLDRGARKVLCRGQPPVPYDLLSINVGSAPRMEGIEGAARAVAVKPIHTFNERWLALLERVRRHAGATAIAVVGAGAAGVELLLAMQYRLCNELKTLGRDPRALRFHLLEAADRILPTHNAAVRAAFARVLAARGVMVHCGARVRRVAAGRLETAAGAAIEADEIVWVTGAGGAPWLRWTGLALDREGCIEVGATLQSSDPLVFAAGDVASLRGRALAKAGVFAVRMGPPLAKNLRLAAAGRPLRPYRPQRRWLALISTGDKAAVASRGLLCLRGAWVWRWKDWIDRRFMAKFGDLPAAAG